MFNIQDTAWSQPTVKVHKNSNKVKDTLDSFSTIKSTESNKSEI